MKEFKELLRVLLAIFRYPAAIVVAFMASMTTVFYLPSFFQSNDSDGWFFFWFFCMGLAGVSAGSFCLPRNQWWIGSLCLLFLGLGFAFWVFCACEDDSGLNLFPLIPLAAGGIIPVLIHCLFRNK